MSVLVNQGTEHIEQISSSAAGFHIGIIEPVGGHGGMDYYDYGLAMGLGANEIRVTLYTCDKTQIREYPNVSTKIYFEEMWASNIFIKTTKYIWGHYRAIRDIKKNAGSIAHLHFFTFRIVDLVVLALVKLFKLKAVVTVHDVNSFHGKANTRIEKLCFELTDGLIVHNTSSLNALRKKDTGKSLIAEIPHGNYLPFINKVTATSEQGKPFTLLFFGQIKEVKGLDILLKAVSLLKDKNFKIRLIIAGKAWKSDLAKYEDLISSLAITDLVETEFKYIPDGEVQSYYSKADLVILPYREIYQSGVLLLTMSYGKPILCSDLAPFKEIIVHKESGFLFKSENPDDLANQVEKIISEPYILEKVIKNSELIIRDRYDWVKIGLKTKHLYQQLLYANQVVTTS